MAQSRWRKVLADLRGNKTRTILTVLTIAVGVFAIGFVAGLGAIMLPDIDANYAAANPHEAMLYTDPFDENVLQAAQQVPGVAEVEGRANLMVRLIVSEDRKLNISIDGIPPLSKMRVDMLRSADPSTPLTLNDGEIWIERGSLALFSVKVGEYVTIQLTNGEVRELRVAGIVVDVSMPTAVFNSALSAFATPATIEQLGGSRLNNKMLITVAENPKDEAHVMAVTKEISKVVEASDLKVYTTWMYNPGEHFSREILVGVMIILNILGGVAVILSGFLVINTINSLLSQHVRQIGIMKAVGGRNQQIVGMYLILVLCFGLLALVIAVPLGAVAAYGTAGGLANYLNVDLRGFRIAPQAVLAQVVTALLIPLLAAAIPVFAGTRISVREAINDYGVRNGHFGRSWIDRAVERVHFLSRPTLLSLRNTFRRKGRLVLTLSTLTLGGAIFIAVFNLWRTCFVMLDEIQGYFMADINVDFSQPYRMDELERLTVGIPEINGIEGWGWNEAEILTDDQVKSDLIGIIAPPSNSMLIQPILKEGRWLAPDDENAIVIGPHLLAKRPDLKVGDDVVIEINRLKTTWHIVGIYKITGNIDPPVVYTNAEILDRYQEEAGMISSLRVITTHNDAETQQRASKALEEAFSQANIQVTQILLGTDWYIQQSSTFNVLIYFLLVMAVLIALVGGLGLTGTMSMNVLERTREIGILRAVGASNGAILRMVITEGVMVGLISWLLALALSLPLTRLLDVGVGSAIFKQTMSFVLGWNGTVYWLGGVIILSTLASALPALRAVRLTVRDVLAYE